MMIRQLFIVSILFLTAGCTTLTTSSTSDCLPIREVEPIKFTLEVKSGVGEPIFTEKQLIQNPDPRSGLIEFSGEFRNISGAFNYLIVPYEVCTDGLRIRYENSTNRSDVIVPWNRATVIDGARNSNYFVEISATKGE